MAFPADVLSTDGFGLWRTRYNSFKNAAAERVESTSIPGSSDDNYSVGAIWIKTDSDIAYVMVDNTAAAAVWQEIMEVGATPTAHLLDSHSNVTITSNSAGEILKWSGSAWINNTLVEAGIQPTGDYANLNDLDGNDADWLSLSRSDATSPVMYLRQAGAGDIARFFKNATTLTTSGAEQVTITNSGGIIATGNITAPTFAGVLTGDVTGDVTGNITGSSGSCTGNAASASAISTATTSDTELFPMMAETQFNGVQTVRIDAGLKYDAVDNKLTTTTFVGALTGNASTASKWLTSRTVTFATGDVTGSFSIDGSADVTNIALSSNTLAVQRIHLKKSVFTEDVRTTPQVIRWDAEDVKDSIYTHSNVTNSERVTVSEAGVYRITANVNYLMAGVARITATLELRKNGVIVPETLASGYSRGAAYGDFNTLVVTTISLAANDYIDVWGDFDDADDTSACTSIVASSHLIVERVSTEAVSNTWRAIHDSPVNAATTISISSNWAYDHNVANNHIDWTNASSNLVTSGTAKAGDAIIGQTTQTLTTLSTGQWDKQSGYSGFIASGSTGVPEAVHGYWHILGRRDSSSGYGGLWQSYTTGKLYSGYSTIGADPTWVQVGTVLSVTDGNGITGAGTAQNPTFSIVSHAGSAGFIGTVNVGTDTLGVYLGTTSTVACSGADSRLSDARTPLSHTHDSHTGVLAVAEGGTGATAITGTAGNNVLSSSPTFQGILYNDTTSRRVKYATYSNSTYGFGMQSSVTFGGLSSWAQTAQTNNVAGYGFWWGADIHTTAQGGMALTYDGKLTVAHSMRIGYGISDTTAPGATGEELDVMGDVNITETLHVGESLFVAGSAGVTAEYGIAAGDTSLAVGGNFGLRTISDTYPILVMDGSDYIGYDRTNNKYEFYAAAGLQFSLNATVADFQNNAINTTGTLSCGHITTSSSTKVTNLNADLLDGYNYVSASGAINTVVGRNGSGDIFARLFRSTYAAAATIGSTADIVFRNDTSDNYLRFLDGTSGGKHSFRDWAGVHFEKHISIEAPALNDEIIWFFTNRAITATELRLVAKGTSSITLQVYHGTSVATGNLVDSNAVTSTTSGHDITAFTDATIPANSFVWVKISAVTTAPDLVHATLIGTYD